MGYNAVMKIKTALLSGVCLLVLGMPSWADDLLGGTAYVYGDGSQAFVLDINPVSFVPEIAAHMKVEGGDDILVLTKTLGVRGDVVYQNPAGENVLRQRLVGGLTFYPNASSKGVPVSLSFEGSPAPAPVTIDDWTEAYEYRGSKTKNTDIVKASAKQNPKN